MLTLRISAALSLLCLASLAFSWPCGASSIQPLVASHLKSLMLDENDLPNFTHFVPAGEGAPIAGVNSPATTYDQLWAPFTQDTHPETDPATITDPDRSLGGMRRVLYSADGMYFIEMRMELCPTGADAEAQLQKFLRGSSAIFSEGTFTGTSVIGDESLFRPADYYGSTLIFRAGDVFVMVSGRQSFGSNRNGGPSSVFPPEAVEAVAYQILLRAAQQPELTGVTPQQASVNINGHALPKNVLMLGKQVYVPVAEFAKAMGLTSRWNAKTGALTLSGAGHKAVALTAGSTAAKVGGMAAAALKVSVLKQAGQPVMTLDDLLTLTGGRVTGRSGNVVQVKA